MDLKTVLTRTDSDTAETAQQPSTQCECGSQIQNSVVAGVRYVNEELRLYCANCL